MALDRRDAMTLIGAGLASATSAPVLAKAGNRRAAITATAQDFTRPESRLRAYMLMRGALDDRLAISWLTGRYYGVVEAETTPLFGVASCVFARFRPKAGGGFEGVTAEIAYFTDWATGKVIENFRNPYTGKDCAVPSWGFAPSKILIEPDLSFALAQPRPGFTLNHEVYPIVTTGDDLWLNEHLTSAMALPGGAKPFRYSEAVTYHAKRSALEATAALQVPAEVSFSNIVGWRPWLNMADHPGHMTSFGSGKQGATLATLPPAWLEATRARHPELLADPAAILAPLWNAK